MLVNLNEVLIPAKRNKYGVGLFNAVNMELTRGIKVTGYFWNGRSSASILPFGRAFLFACTDGKKSNSSGGNTL